MKAARILRNIRKFERGIVPITLRLHEAGTDWAPDRPYSGKLVVFKDGDFEIRNIAHA